jgi:alginate O-acetyltransferase complex protein AlgI
MSLASFEYFLFLFAAWCVYWFLPARPRLWWLIAASLGFYATFHAPYLVLILAISTLSAYLCGLRVHRSTRPGSRALWFWGGMAVNVSLLVGLKYLAFLTDNAAGLLALLSVQWRPGVASSWMSIGVSFYTFQALSYLTDVYLGMQEPERDLGAFGLYMSFFPRLLQGPIERGAKLLPQLRVLEGVRAENVRTGLHLLFWGLAKKIVIADRLAPFVNAVYGDVHGFSGLPLIVATYLYALQLYFDFSGYTDMALGAARLFNINLTQNFNRPYTATSIADFWRRWHISLSSWLLDYLFRPLQMAWRDRRTFGTPAALVVTFVVSGAWHGASWGFIVWGLIHGLYLAAAVLYRPLQTRIYRRLGLGKSRAVSFWKATITFHLVCLGWVFFRSDSLADAAYVIRHAITGLPASAGAALTGTAAWRDLVLLGQPPREAVLALLAVGAAFGIERLESRRLGRGGELAWVGRLSWWKQTVFYALALYAMAFCGAATQGFVYAQF